MSVKKNSPYVECIISSNSSKQKAISQSSTETEYIGLTLAPKETLWLKQILIELNRSPNQTVIYLLRQPKHYVFGKESKMHAHAKHIDVRYHFIREKLYHKELIVKYQASTNDFN